MTRYRLSRPLAAMSVALFTALLVVAASPRASADTHAATPDKAQVIGAINKYFNSIHTMRGQFVQFGPDGQRTEGQFAMERPGKVRFHYNPPSTLDVIADGTSVAVRDRHDATQDIWPLGRTPLKFLLSNNIDLTRDGNVTNVDIKPDLITVTLHDNSMFGEGDLVLLFDAKTHELKQWNVIDSQGHQTSVSIYNVSENVPVNDDLFKIQYLRILK